MVIGQPLLDQNTQLLAVTFIKNEEWKKFNDRRIRSFAYGALPYWNANKTIIFMIMDSFENKENEYY